MMGQGCIKPSLVEKTFLDFAKEGILIDASVIFLPLNISNLKSIVETYNTLKGYFNIFSLDVRMKIYCRSVHKK